MTEMSAITEYLRRMVSDKIGIGVCDPLCPDRPLWPEEEVAAMRMTRKRRNEFAAGRASARSAMADIGLPQTAIPMGPDRAPIWPFGLKGSISHCDRAAVALVSHGDQIQSLGVDIEEDHPLDRSIWDTVLTTEEQVGLAAYPKSVRGIFAKQMFSAKEAVFKAQYPITKKFLSFRDVTLTKNRQGFFAMANEPNIQLNPQQVLCEVIENLIISIASCHNGQSLSSAA